jgi:A/G-specific adenine glycosylase
VKHSVILQWFDENKRDLPWRKTDAWGVMVSEFMLQQTPVNRVLPKWHEWMERWPDPAALAAAKKSDVISAWGRLGYPRRAIRLHECAKIIAASFNNQVPRAIEELRSLPGIGDYTAAAIASFAYGDSALVLDVNIRRFFSRVYDGVEAPKASLSQYERRIRAELIPSDAAKWAAATMEFGALICTARSPLCDQCPVKNSCAWRAAGYPKSEIKSKAQAWDGTDRKCRGTIVQALRENKQLSKGALKKLWQNEEQVEKAFKTLLADGLIEISTTGKSFKLAD